MKVFLSTAMLVLGVLCPAMGQYTNSSPFSSPPSDYPHIDSTNFVNLSSFNISSPSSGQNPFPFTFSDVLFFTNRSSMTSDTGFIFEDQPSNNGSNRPSAIFGNASSGVIGVATNQPVEEFFGDPGDGFIGFAPLLTIWATNVVNAGILAVGAPGVMQISGNVLNLSRGTMQVEGFADYTLNADNFDAAQIGIFGNLAGVGLQTNVLSVATFNPSGQIVTPPSTVTFAGSSQPVKGFQFTLPNGSAEGFAWADMAGVSNRTVEAVLVNTNLPGITVDVRRLGGGAGIGFGVPYIKWQAVITNNTGLPTITNLLFLADSLGVFQSNSLVTSGYTISGAPELEPSNYFFTRIDPGFSGFNPPDFTPYDAQTLFGNAFGTNGPPPVETNLYSVYETSIQPVTFQQDNTTLATTVSNLPGRLQITAATSLDLTLTKIYGPNYLSLSSTNHFVGATNALIIAPNMDLNLGSTNGSISISNVIYPYVPRFVGIVDLYSCKWTNVDVNGITNTYHVLIADASLSPTSPALVINFGLRSTNIFISDVVNVESNANVNGNALTITTNGATSPNHAGEVNLLYNASDWSTAFPNLQFLTNLGSISASSGTFFDITPSNRPYASFVNHGGITNGTTMIWANYAENSSPTPGGALIDDFGGTFSLLASNAVLFNSGIVSSSDLSVASGNLTISNEILFATGALTFTVTNTLFDGGLATTNIFQAGDGLNLLAKPVTGDFLDSVIDLTAPASQIVYNTWAATNKGAIPQGFQNNAALGHLILDGGDAFSQYYFTGPDNTNAYAMYVDLIDLRDGATNRTPNSDGTELFDAFAFGATNFTIYFADAVVGPNDISEKLNGANGGQLVWVPAYAGRFSSTNLVYPTGVTNTFNRALVLSTTIDSDADGTVNAFDLTPIYTANSVNFSIGTTNLPPRAAILHWNLLGHNASNIVYFKTNLLSTNWTFLTNISTSGLTVPNYSFIDRAHTNSSTPVFYKLQVDAMQP